MATEIKRLRVVIEGDDSGMKNAESSVERLTGKTSALGNTVSTALGTFAGSLMTKAVDAVTDFVQKGVQGFGDLQQQVANISTIAPKIDTSQVFNSLNAMQTRVPQSAAQLGDALYDVFSSINVTQKEGLKLVEDFAKGAVGAQTEAKTFGTAVVGVMNAYGVSVEGATHLQDLFFNTVKSGVVTGQELASSLGDVTKAARTAGQPVEVLFAAIAAGTKEGGPAAQNINNLNNLFQKLTTDKAKEGFDALGISVTTAGGSFRQINEIVSDFIAKTKGFNQAQLATALNNIFPDAQARQGFQTLVSQYASLNAALKENQTVTGAAADAYEKMSGTFQSQSKLLQNSLQAIATAVGAEILPRITPLISVFAHDLPAALDQVKPFLKGVEIGFRTTFAPLMPLVRDVTAFVVQQWGVLIGWFQANLPLIQRTVSTVLNAIAAFWKEHGEAIKSILQNGLNIVLGIVKLAMQILTGDWSGATKTIEKIVTNLLQIVGTLIGKIPALITAVFTKLIPTLVDLGSAILEGLARGIVAGGKMAVDAVIGIAKQTIEGIKSVFDIHSPSRVMMGIGVFVIEGLVEGIRSGKVLLQDTTKDVLSVVNEQAQALVGQVKAARRELWVAMYGEGSAQVLKMDNPLLTPEYVRQQAAEIARLTALTEKQNAYNEAIRQFNAAWSQVRFSLPVSVVAGAGPIGTVSPLAPEFPIEDSGSRDLTLKSLSKMAILPKAPASSIAREQAREILDTFGQMAEQYGRRFLADILGGRNRGDILKSLWREMTYLGQDAISTLIEGQLRHSLAGVLQHMGGLLKEEMAALKVSVSTVLSVVNAAYQLLAASGRKKQFGLGSVLGAIGGLILAGGNPLGAIAGYNVGNAVDNNDWAGAAIGLATSVAGGSFAHTPTVAAKPGVPGLGSGAYGGGFSRGVQVTQNIYGGVHNAADLNQVNTGMAEAVRSGLRSGA